MILVDCEASGPSPFNEKCTEFGAVDFATRATFYGHLWPFTPHPDRPAVPVVHPDAAPEPWFQLGQGPGSGREDRHNVATISDVFAALAQWLNTHDGRPVLISDNPGFDAAWIAYGFDADELPNPFGHSSRRIGDLAAGLARNYRSTSAWKRHRRTRHTHNPVDDALGNAEALEHLLRTHNQLEKKPPRRPR